MTTNQQGIAIPSNPVKVIDLGVKVYARHCVMGDASPLLALQLNSWEDNGRIVSKALILQELIEKKPGLIQECLQKRDELIVRIKASIESSYDLLSDIYRDNLSELCYWGFDIDELLNINSPHNSHFTGTKA